MLTKINSGIEIYGYLGCRDTIPCTRHLLARKSGAFPAIVSFADGEVFSFYRGTADHVGHSNIQMISSKDSGETWTDPVNIAPEGIDPRNPAVGVIEPNKIVVLYAVRHTNDQMIVTKWEMKYRISRDRGKTWSGAMDIPSPPGWTYCSSGGGNNLTPCAEGLIGNIFGLKGDERYYDSSQMMSEWWAFPMYFSDIGERWTPTLEPFLGSDEIDYFQTSRGWKAAIRNGGIKHHGTYVSTFNGSWSKPKMIFEDGLGPTRITRLPGALLATIGRRRYPYGAQAMLSYDEGETWDWDTQILLAGNCGEGTKQHDNGYASSTYLPDGHILSVWYKNWSDAPYFENTGRIYTLEMAKYRWEDLKKVSLNARS